MIVEGLLTTVDSAGKINVAPMGPIVSDDFQKLLLRPFQPSTSFTNLSETRVGVFHVVDRVDIIARAAIGQLTNLPPVVAANTVTGYVLQDCCRWFELEVDSVDATEARSLIPSTVVFTGERRPFFGFNRARHAVLEAAIIATRIHLLDWTTINQAFEFLAPAVSKTGGPIEKDSFEMLREYVQTRRDASS